MKAQYPSALDKQCSKHSTQLGAKTKPEVCKHQPGAFPSERDNPLRFTEEGLAPLNCCLRALLCFRKQKKTPTLTGLDRREQKKQ